MPLLDTIETVKEDIAGVLRIGSEQVALSQKELLLFGLLRLILGGIGGTGGDGSVSIDNEALAGAIANALELKTLTVAGDTVNETVLANAIAANTQPISASSLPLPTDAATETTLSALSAKLPSPLISGRLSVDGSAVTQPISVASLPLPAGAATSVKQPALGTAGTPSTDVITVQGIASGVAQPISASSLPLPTGAATSAKQPALGIAGTPSTDVITVQGVASGTPLPASQSGAWQLRLQDGAGNAITSQVSGAQRAVDTQILLSGSAIDPRSIRALTSADIVSFAAISKRVSATFTRPADTAAYAAGDAMGSSTSTPTILTFANSARISAGTGIITKARLVKNSTNTTNAAFRLWLFSSSPTGANDNAVFILSYSSAGSRLGYIDFPAFVTEGTGSDCAECEVIGLASQFYAAATSLFGVLVARAAYTPTSGEQFFVELALEQN